MHDSRHWLCINSSFRSRYIYCRYYRLFILNFVRMIKHHIKRFLRQKFANVNFYSGWLRMEPPQKPDPSDCCNSGCNPCILDVYEKKLQEYNKKTTIDRDSEINVLKDTAYTNFKLISIIPIVQDIVLYTFEFLSTDKNPDKNLVLKFTPGQYFILKGASDTKEEEQKHFTRPYTPITCTYNNIKLILPQSVELIEKNNLVFQTIIKLEPKGAMSNLLRQLKLGDITAWRGPYGDFDYEILLSQNFKHLICFTQGVGLAPVFCIINEILQDESNEIVITLNSCFRNTESIILRKEIHQFQQYWNFKCHIFLAHARTCRCSESDCNCFIQKINYGENIYNRRLEEMDIQNNLLSKNTSEVYVIICGAERFSDNVKKHLINFNFSKENLHVF